MKKTEARNLKPGDKVYVLVPNGARLSGTFIGTTIYKSWYVIGRKNPGTKSNPFFFWPGGKNQIALSEECSESVLEFARKKKLTYFRYAMPVNILLKKGNKDEQH